MSPPSFFVPQRKVRRIGARTRGYVRRKSLVTYRYMHANLYSSFTMFLFRHLVSELFQSLNEFCILYLQRIHVLVILLVQRLLFIFEFQVQFLLLPAALLIRKRNKGWWRRGKTTTTTTTTRGQLFYRAKRFSNLV